MSHHLAMSIVVNIQEQSLLLLDDETSQPKKEYTIATAKNGVGQIKDSECTPLGQHVIRAKIGANQPVNTVFTGRRPTGEIYSNKLAEEYPIRDWILTRIMWLSGCEKGVNRLGDCDTMQRYIYIHGAPDSHEMGVPSSHGCIKMRNQDIIELFELVPVGTHVSIRAT